MDAMYYYYLRLQDFLQPRRRRFILSLQKCKRGKMMFASIHHFSRKLNSLLCIHTTFFVDGLASMEASITSSASKGGKEARPP